MQRDERGWLATQNFAKKTGRWVRRRDFKENFLLHHEAVKKIQGDPFLPKPDISFVEQVTDYVNKIGGKANSSFGEVVLNKKGVKNSKEHGMGRAKAAAFIAIKDVLDKSLMTQVPLHFKTKERW